MKYLGPALSPGFEGPAGEGDHTAALVGDGKHDPLAEAVIDVALRPVALLLGAEKPRDAQGLGVGHAAETVAQGVEAVRRLADAEGLDSLRRQSPAGKVFARHGAFGPTQLFFKEGGCRLMQVEKLAALAAFGGLFGEENSRLGKGMPHFCATMRTASGKPTFSILPTKLKTSPEAWQPKQ